MEPLLVQSDSDCPSAEVVQAEVRELTTVEQRRGVPPGARAVINDRGESIAIALTRDGKTTVRVYHDAARDCARRGHFVSVLVVVSLMPPELGSDPEASPAPSPRPQTPSRGETDAGRRGERSAATNAEGERPDEESTDDTRADDARDDGATDDEPSAPRGPRSFRIELQARARTSTPLGDSVRVADVAGALGIAVGSGTLRFTLSGAYAPKRELRYTGNFAGKAELERLDVALGGRLSLGHDPVDTSLDLALVLSRAVVTGLGSLRTARATAVSPGLRTGFHVCWSEQRLLSPFIGAHAELYPFAPAISQLPQGTVGHLPYVWIGVSGGLTLAL